MIHLLGTQCLLQQHYSTGLSQKKKQQKKTVNTDTTTCINMHNCDLSTVKEVYLQIFRVEVFYVWIYGSSLIQIQTAFISAAKIRLVLTKMGQAQSLTVIHLHLEKSAYTVYVYSSFHKH